MSRRPDLATAGGLALALAGILGGLVLEQGKVRDVAQLTAALIVMGGTLGAVMVTTPMGLLRRAAGKLPAVFLESRHAPAAIVEQIIGYATKARRNGIVSLEDEAASIADPFLRKALNLAVDGTDLQDLRRMMELDIALEEQLGEAEAKVYEAAGGLRADHRDHRRGLGADPSHEAPGQYRRRRARHCGGLRGYRLRRGFG